MRDEDWLTGVVDELRHEVTVRPEARARLDAAVRAAPRPRRGGPGLWLIEPRTWRLSPLVGLAAAAAIGAIGFGLGTLRQEAAPGRPAAPAAAIPAAFSGPTEIVRFTVDAPDARSVALVGDFNGWDPAATPLQRVGGRWMVALPLPRGRHVYGFVVDGASWIPDPAAPRDPGDDFGGTNSVVFVGGAS